MSNFASFRQGISRSQYGTEWGENMLKLSVNVFEQDEKMGTCWCLILLSWEERCEFWGTG